MQHILISVSDSIISIDPVDADLWRDDQGVMWEVIEPLMWDNATPHTNAAVFFTNSDWTDDGGSTPAPIGEPPAGDDRRIYIAMGPGSNQTSQVVTYAYDVAVTDGTSRFVVTKGHTLVDVKSADIDPDISNQPHP